MGRGLLTYLADRFVTQREDLATEALLYILQQSETASAEVLRVVNDLGYTVHGKAVNFRSQVTAESGERPDLVALIDGQERVLFEAKFWAGLTDHQPVSYLTRIATAPASGALVFIVPEKRLEILWVELERRIRESGASIGPREDAISGGIAADAAGARLALVTWLALLNRLEQALSAGREIELLESLRQLKVLCEREDKNAFLPVTGEELTSSVPLRIAQFGEIVDDAVTRLVTDGLASTDGLRASAGKAWYGRYLLIDGAGCLLHVHTWKWAEVQSTPIWLKVKDRNWELSPELRSAFEIAQSRGEITFFDLERSGLEVPIEIAKGRDRSAVLDHVVDQLHVVYRVIRDAALPAKRSVSGPDDEDSEVEGSADLGDS